MAIKSVGGKYEGVLINELKNGNVSFYIRYRDVNDIPVKKKVGTKTPQSNFTIKDAYDRLIEVKHKLSTGEELPKVVEKKSKNIFFSELYEEYEKWAKNNNTSWELDKGIYNNHLNDFHKRNIKTITSQDFEDLKNEKLKEFSPRTVENILRLAKAIYNHAIKIDYVKKLQNPLSNGRVKFPKVDNKQLGYLKKDEAQKILDYFLINNFPRLYQLSALMLFTGARFIEIVSLEWDDVNFSERLIYFKKTKDGDDRFIKMSDRVYEVLQELQNEKNNTKLVIPNAIGTQYKQMPKQWQDNVDKIFPNNVNLGKNRITPHSLRHTHASWLAQKGVNILHIKKQLGHKKLETTMRYAHISDKQRYEETLDIAF
jgi:integrase